MKTTSRIQVRRPKYAGPALLFTLLLSLCPALFPQAGLRAQSNPVKSLVFSELVYDFGDLKLSDGSQVHEFSFVNKGDKPVVIQTVVSSCGCTVPGWSKKPILPGQSGYVTATFLNNQGAFPFDKSLSVYTNAATAPIVLRIRGVVHAKKVEVADTHPILVGKSLRLRKNVLELGQIPQGTVKTDSTDLINTGDRPLRLSVVQPAAPGRLELSPAVLAPGAKGRLIYTLDASAQNHWGNVSVTGQLHIDGAPAPNNQLEIKGTVKLNSSGMTAAQKEMAPLPQVSSSSHNFYVVDKGKPVSAVFTLYNRGKSPLKIYKIDYSHPGVEAQVPVEIPVGNSTPVRVTVNRPEDKGEVIYTVSLITNAPARPIINLLVYGEYR